MGMKEIGKRIKESRVEIGFTQSELALRIGVTAQAVSKWERGQSLPDVLMMVAVGKQLCKSLDYLMNGVDKKVPVNLLDSITNDMVELEFGIGLIPAFTEQKGLDKIAALRVRMLTEVGIYIYPIRVRDHKELEANGFRIRVHGDVVVEGAYVDTMEIKMDDYLVEQLSVVLDQYKVALMTLAGTKQLLEQLVDGPYDIVNDVIPHYISLVEFHKYLVKKVQDGESIKGIGRLLEGCVDGKIRV